MAIDRLYSKQIKTHDLTEENTMTVGEIVTESGLKIKTNVEGTGVIPTKGQTIIVHYVGELTDGRKFDSSFDKNKVT